MTQYLDIENLRKSVDELLQQTEAPLTKNKIAKILGIRGDDRLILKKLLKEMEHGGTIQRGKKRRLVGIQGPLAVNNVLAIEVTNLDDDGDLYGIPLDWNESSPPPSIHLVELKSSHKSGRVSLGLGSKVLVRLRKTSHHEWEGVILKRFEERKKTHLGVFTPNRHGGQLLPCHRKDKFIGARLSVIESENLKEGDVVEYATAPLHGTKILKIIGKIQDPTTYSKIAALAYGLPEDFSKESLALAESGKIPSLNDRIDFRSLDLVTIDGEDARDFDDAVWACADDDPRNPHGWRILVAIADVAYYVKPDDALDKEARQRGNSVYFPDRVIPMLPEALSNELCSLKPHVDRACMAIEMIITAHGKIKSHRIKRGLMRSRARLTYTQVQNAIDGTPDEITQPLFESVIHPLYAAYQSLLKARQQRGTLNLDMPERQIIFNTDGSVQNIVPRPHCDSHKLIEEFMIAANVCAAKTLTSKNWPCLYRVHDTPTPERIANLRQILKQMKLSFPKTLQPTPHQFNALLHDVAEKPFERMINNLILRSQAQACYSPLNIGHYGLSLAQYAHFTSPIRRYADLIVHRALISALKLGDDGLKEHSTHLHQVAVHISSTERQAAIAERDVIDRFVISHLVPHIGKEYATTIVGVNKFGLFVEIESMGAQGFIPKSTLSADYFQFDPDHHRLVGRRTKETYQLGQRIQAQLTHADPTTNSLGFAMIQSSKKFERRKK